MAIVDYCFYALCSQNVGIHIANRNNKSLNVNIVPGVATQHYRRQPVTQGSFIVVFWIYT